MTVFRALKAARAAGIRFKIDGENLVLQAATQPPASIIDLLSRHKTEVLAMLAAREYESNENRLAAPCAPCRTVTPLSQGEPSFDQPCSARRGRIEQSGGALLHFCVECGRLGFYGSDVHLRAGRLGRWYCREHRPQDQPK
jgi:hypothetical protein